MVNTKEKTINRIIFILSLIGMAIAIYVTQSFLRKTNILCANTGCELVRKNPASYLFGFFPVPAVGLIGYSILAVLSFLRTTADKTLSNTYLLGMLGMAGFGVCFVGWFTYTELFVIKGICTWCIISAINMMVIFALVIKSYRIGKTHG